MADEIKQRFSIDVDGAIDALKRLDAGLVRFETQLTSVADRFRRFNSDSKDTVAALKAIASAANRASNAMGKLDGLKAPSTRSRPSFGDYGVEQSIRALQGADEHARKLNNSVHRLTVSWEMMSRIVTTQAIVRALSQFRRVATEAINGAIDFQTKLAEIQTISPAATIASLSSEIRGLSDAFNLPALDVAAAKYEAISNGFTSAAQQQDILTASFKFSKVALTDANKSLDLLSSVINSYGLSAAEAESISGRLFQAINVGKVTGDELAHSLGRVTSVASQLGVPLDEVLAQFTTLTIGGVNASEAATQVSATLSALVKPSAAAAESFQKLGFQSAETAIRTLGLQGTIKGLISTTDGSIESIAKLFPNVRSLRDVLRVAPNDATLAEHLREIQNFDASKLNEVLGRRLAIDAERVTTEVNKLTNALTVDLGQAILKDVARLANLTGGVDGAIHVFKTFAPVLETGTVLMTAYAAAALKGATANEAFVSKFKGASAGLLLGAGAFTAGDFLGKQLIDAITAPEREFDRLAKTSIEKLRTSEAERLRQLEIADDNRLDETLKSVANLNKAYLDDVKNAESSSKLLVQNANRTADEIVKAREKLAQSFEKAIDDSRQLAEDSRGRVADLQLRKQDLRFDQSTKNLSDTQKVFALNQRSAELASQAAADLDKAARAGDKAGIDRALQLFAKAEQSAGEAGSIAERTENRVLEAQAAGQVEAIIERQIAAEKKLQAVQLGRQQGLDALAKKQLAALDALRQQTDIIRRNSGITDAGGKLLDPAEIAKRQAAVQAALTKIRQSGLSESDIAQADRLGLGQQAREFQLQLSQQALQLDFDVTGGVQRIQAQLQQSFNNFKLKLNFDVGNLESVLGRQFTSPEEVAQGLEEIKSRAGDLREALSASTVDQENIKRLKTELLGINAALESGSRFGLRFLGPLIPTNDQSQRLGALRKELTGLANDADLTDKEITDFFQRVAQFGDSAALATKDLFGGGLAKNIGFTLDFNELSRAAGLLKELQGFQRPAPTGAATELQQLEVIIRSIEAANPAASFNEATSAIGRGVAPAASIERAFQGATSATAAMAANMRAVAAAAADAARASQNIGSGETQNAAFGGRIAHLASGGQAKGTDNVPALLSEGEFVVNAASSRRWFAQLQQINSGVPPTMSPGDSTTYNVSIGDINVNATEAKGDVIGRDIAARLNRDIRRGVVRLK